ncbi:MAG: hypothetical protein ACOCUH_01020 [Bacteriovoracia bacterium]
MMTTKYDKVLSELLAKFYTDSNVKEEVRRIVQEVINAEMNELNSLRPRVMDEIISVIEDEAKEIAKNKK